MKQASNFNALSRLDATGALFDSFRDRVIKSISLPRAFNYMSQAFLNRKIFSYFLSCAFVLFFAVCFTVAQTDESNSDSEANQSRAIASFERGQNAHEKGDLALAVKSYEEAIKLFPEFPEAEYQLGAAQASLGNATQAEKAFRRAVGLREDWSLAWAKLGETLADKHLKLYSAAPESEETKQVFSEAVKVLQKAIDLDASNFPAFVGLVELRLRFTTSANTLNELLAQIRTATEGKSNVPATVWAARGALERVLKDNRAAKESLNRALRIDSQNVLALMERAQIVAAEGDASAAIVDLQNAVRLAPLKTRWQAQVLLAGLLAETGKIEDARKVLDAVDEAAQARAEVTSLKNALIASGAEGAEGIEFLEKTLKTDPKNAAVLGRLCSLTRTISPQKSLDYCRRASELEPNEIKHAVGYGAALVQARQFDQAVALFRKLLELEPKNFTARQNLALALYELKRYNEAIEEFERLIDAKPDAAVAYYFLATANDFEGSYVAALAAYQKFLELAKPETNQLEIDKVRMRLPAVARQVEKGAGKKKKP